MYFLKRVWVYVMFNHHSVFLVVSQHLQLQQSHYTQSNSNWWVDLP